MVARNMKEASSRILLLGSERLSLQGDLQRLVTFLNQTLAREGFEFGLRKEAKDTYVLAVYRTGGDPAVARPYTKAE